MATVRYSFSGRVGIMISQRGVSGILHQTSDIQPQPVCYLQKKTLHVWHKVILIVYWTVLEKYSDNG